MFGKKASSYFGKRVLDILKSKPLTKEQMNAHVSNNQKEHLQMTLDQLEAAGLVRRRVEKTGGRPRTLWELIPEAKPGS